VTGVLAPRSVEHSLWMTETHEVREYTAILKHIQKMKDDTKQA
jgi:hypothetical protein